MRKVKKVEIKNPGSHHLHRRQGNMLAQTSLFDRVFSGVVLMPNLPEPVTTGERFLEYYDQEVQMFYPETLVVGGIMLTPETTQQMVADAHLAGASFIKNIPKGVSTNAVGVLLSKLLSADMMRVYDTASLYNMPILLHVQSRRDQNLTRYELRELSFLLKRIHLLFPRLKISIEHINTKPLVNLVRANKWLTAGIAPHYVSWTTESVFDQSGGVINPTLYCQPPYGDLADLGAVGAAMLYGDRSQFRYAPDCAPQTIKAKTEAQAPAAGVFHALADIPFIVSIFEKARRLEHLQYFLGFDEEFFGVKLEPKHQKNMTLIKEEWKVPSRYKGDSDRVDIPIAWGGQTMEWRIASQI